MENREMPILHKSQALDEQMPQMVLENFFFAGTSRQRKILFLGDLCASVVKANNFMLCLIIQTVIHSVKPHFSRLLPLC